MRDEECVRFNRKLNMKIALIYDKPDPNTPDSWVEAEYETSQTIDALRSALQAHCDEVVTIEYGPDFVAELQRHMPDLAFNIAEGRSGSCRESIVPIILDHWHVPYTGSDGVALGISLNKAVTKILAAHGGIRTPQFHLFRSGNEVHQCIEALEFPVLIKPNLGGSSVGIGPESIIYEAEDLACSVDECAVLYDQPCLVEQYIEGRDVTVGLLGNEQLETLPIGMIDTAEGMYSARAKSHHERQITCPCALPEQLANELKDWSVKIFHFIGASDFARVDYMLDKHQEPYFLEINPLPGLSPYYGVMPVLAKAAGYDHTELIGEIVHAALERREIATKLL